MMSSWIIALCIAHVPHVALGVRGETELDAASEESAEGNMHVHQATATVVRAGMTVSAVVEGALIGGRFRVIAPAWPKSALGDKYSSPRSLGAGGFGMAYVATDIQSGEKVVVKLMLEDADTLLSTKTAASKEAQDRLAMARMECKRAEALATPNKAFPEGASRFCKCVHDGVDNPEVAYIVLEYLGDYDMYKYMQAQKQLSSADLYRILRMGLEGLASIEGNWVLRDIKLENIMIFAGSQGLAMKYIDFGLAVESGVAPKTMGGSLMTMPPEAYLYTDDRVDGRFDVYSLAATLYDFLCDGPLFFKVQGKMSVNGAKKVFTAIANQKWDPMTMCVTVGRKSEYKPLMDFVAKYMMVPFKRRKQASELLNLLSQELPESVDPVSGQVDADLVVK